MKTIWGTNSYFYEFPREGPVTLEFPFDGRNKHSYALSNQLKKSFYFYNFTGSLIWDSFNLLQKESNRLSTPIIEETFDEENDNIIKTDKPDVGDVSTIQNTSFENMMEEREKTFPSEIHNAKHETSHGDDNNQNQSPAIDSATGLANTSVILSESGSSRAQSRYSTLSHSTAASRPRLQGFFQKGALVANNSDNSAMQCPYPSDWQYGTVPEVITNSEEID